MARSFLSSAPSFPVLHVVIMGTVPLLNQHWFTGTRFWNDNTAIIILLWSYRFLLDKVVEKRTFVLNELKNDRFFSFMDPYVLEQKQKQK